MWMRFGMNPGGGGGPPVTAPCHADGVAAACDELLGVAG